MASLRTFCDPLSRLHVAQRTQINPAQQFVRFEIVGIALQNVLRFEHCIANAAGLGIELSQCRGQIFGSRIGFDGLAVFLDRFIGQFTAAVHRNLLLVHVRQRVVVIGGSLVRLAGAADGSAWLRCSLAALAPCAKLQQRPPEAR